MGILYVVPTPVGNLEDITLRALRILREADLILAEDTRTSGILLKHYDIHNQLLSHHKFNEHGTSAAIVERLKAGQTIALISDAGTPGISDPGFFLVREAVNAGIDVQLSYQHWWHRVFPMTVSASRGSSPKRKVGRHAFNHLAKSCAQWSSTSHPTDC